MNNKIPRTPFSTPLSGSARETELRLKNIFSGPKKRPPALFLALVFSACLLCGNLVSCQVKATPDPEAEVWVDYFDAEEMPWDKIAATQLEEYPGVTFRWTSDSVTASDGTGETTLIGGMPVWNVFLCDLNGDGKREFCTTVTFGSGIADNHIEVYDYAAGQLYLLWDRMEYDYALSLEDGQLRVSRWEYQGGRPSQGEPLSTGGLALSSDSTREGEWFIAQPASLFQPDEPAAAEPDLGWNSFSAQKQVDPPAVDPDPAARAAFAGLLEGRLSERGQFALCDVTGLGTEDLILFQGDACTVYSYFPESGTLECVLEESANILFFENGSAVVAWSHNAGKGGRFWPYIHYRYNPGYQVYSPADNVDAFDRQIAEDNDFLDQYPQEVDTSNAGFVYYFIDEEGGYSDPVDLSYYRDWWEGYFHNVSPMKLPLWDLTAASISALT